MARLKYHTSADGAQPAADHTIETTCGKIAHKSNVGGWFGGPNYSRPRHMLRELLRNRGTDACANCKRLNA